MKNLEMKPMEGKKEKKWKIVLLNFIISIFNN
jgi:hypothetical protein